MGQFVSIYAPTKSIQAVAGVLISFVATCEIWAKRDWFCSFCAKKKKKDDVWDKEGQAVNGDIQDTEKENGSISRGGSSSSAEEEELIIGCNKATFITLLAGGTSGFLGGMVAIRGAPLIFYFLHPPHPILFNKDSSRATGVAIMFCNVTMRQIFYLVETFTPNSTKVTYDKDDWRLYLSVIICAIAGGLVGSKLFEYMKDSRNTIRGILSIFLFLCGVSLLFSAFR